MTTIYKRKLYRNKPIKLNWFDMHPFCSGALAMFALIALLFFSFVV